MQRTLPLVSTIPVAILLLWCSLKLSNALEKGNQYCLNDSHCKNATLCPEEFSSCCNLDYDTEDDLTLYCWCCKYNCNVDYNYCKKQNVQPVANMGLPQWKWVSFKEKTNNPNSKSNKYIKGREDSYQV